MTIEDDDYDDYLEDDEEIEEEEIIFNDARIDRTFEKLTAIGYICKTNWKCCQTCGCAALPENTEKYVFYHMQDSENFASSGEGYLAWGGDGAEICAALRAENLTVEWDGSNNTRIKIDVKEGWINRNKVM